MAKTENEAKIKQGDKRTRLSGKTKSITLVFCGTEDLSIGGSFAPLKKYEDVKAFA